MAWLAQIGLFVMLGLLVSPEPHRPGHGLAGVAGRTGSDVRWPGRSRSRSRRSCSPWELRELAFISWAGLRGAVPIVLATIPLAEGLDGATQLFDIVFVFVVIYTLLTAPSLPLVAKVLKVARRSEPRDLEVEAAPLERIAADLLQVTISPKSLMHGVEVGELRLPAGSSVALIVRDGKTLVPERRTVLRHGDDVLVVTPRKDREATERRLRAVSATADGWPNGWGRPSQTASGSPRSHSERCCGLHRLGHDRSQVVGDRPRGRPLCAAVPRTRGPSRPRRRNGGRNGGRPPAGCVGGAAGRVRRPRVSRWPRPGRSHR